ncbi:MAG TPA: TSUP family transporter [Methylomirabilota bacterium]|nr:TSUP family transporter [Methylomirabilota bacterium]
MPDARSLPQDGLRAPTMHLIAIVLGGIIGILVGFLGVGGGVVLVPTMVYVLHFDQHVAQGTSLLMQLPPLGLGALLIYWKRKEVDVAAGILCALGFLLGGYFGSVMAIGMASRNLRGLFGLFQMIAAVLLWRRHHAKRTSEAQRA